MSKTTLDDYRDGKSEKYIEDNYEAGATGGLSEVYEIGEPNFKAGFDAAISLELPVKFADWRDGEEINNTVLWNQYEGNNPLLYKYWIKNILKLE